MGLLDGDIAALFHGVFSGIYLDGTLVSGTGKPIYDGPRITGYADADETEVKVQITEASSAMQREKGYVGGDRAVILLAQGIGPVTSDMLVTIDRGEPLGAETYRLHSARLDSAASHWVCRGRKL